MVVMTWVIVSMTSVSGGCDSSGGGDELGGGVVREGDEVVDDRVGGDDVVGVVVGVVRVGLDVVLGGGLDEGGGEAVGCELKLELLSSSCRRWIATPFWPTWRGSMKVASTAVIAVSPATNRPSIRLECIATVFGV